MTRAPEAADEVVRGVERDRLDGHTPCPGPDVRGPVNHPILWTGFRGYTAGLRQPPGRPGAAAVPSGSGSAVR
ncbi:hypothetical protein CA984_33025 [Streptosporangium minutum]|uniref:Uncharacterized protein n=1 Tax=Streptosporangium minutum TaxID=569862 RepID=A0A243RCE2_9ACTN|nr:hypothetical protein CA984_33025 [Streptosporangium minutum]